MIAQPRRRSNGESNEEYPINQTSNRMSRLPPQAEATGDENDRPRTNVPHQHALPRKLGDPTVTKSSIAGQDFEDQNGVNMSDDLRRFLAKNTRLIDQECAKLHAIFGYRSKDNMDDESTEEEVISDVSGSYEEDDECENSLGELWTELSLSDEEIPEPRPPSSMNSCSVSNRRGKMMLPIKQDHASDISRSLDISMDYTLFDHCTFLKVSELPHLGFVCDTSDCFDLSPHRRQGSIFELCQPVPDQMLREVFFGLSSSCDSPTKPSAVQLPVRTTTIHIRPDVMCGEVMNAVFVAISACSNRSEVVHLLKRQGGHLRAVVANGDESVKYVYDAQMCIRKTGPYGRFLVIRIYHLTAEELAEVENPDGITIMGHKQSPSSAFDNLKNPLDLQLREACALVKLIRASEDNLNKVKSDLHWQDSAFPNSKRVNSPQSASLYLRSVGRTYMSIENQKNKDHFQQFPALNAKDWHVIQASTRALDKTWYCLADSLVYSSLEITSSGDVDGQCELLDLHYCMQLYLMTRESTLQDIGSLLEAVEKQISHVEEINSTFWRVLRTMVDRYDLCDVTVSIEEDTLPPDDSCLEIVQSLASERISRSGILSKEILESSSRLDVVESAVRVVHCGYEVHLGATHNERIESLYSHATTRLSRKESWLRKVYNKFVESATRNDDAIIEADAFKALALQCTKIANPDYKDDDDLQNQCGIESLVVLRFDIDRGTCWVSTTHLVVVVRNLFQKQKVSVFSLHEIEVRTKKSWGGHFEVKRGDEIYSLRPLGLDAQDVSLFIGILQHLSNKK